MNSISALHLRAFALVLLLSLQSHTLAQKKGGGGKPGGGSDGPSYAIIPLDGGGYIRNGGRGEVGAFDISDFGQVVGAGSDPISDRTAALFWYVSGNESQVIQLRDIPNLDRYYAVGRAVNNLNEIAGWTSTLDATGTHRINALYWPSPLDAPLVLPALSADGFAYAYDINDSGLVCGVSADLVFDADGAYLGRHRTAVVWKVTQGQPRVIGPFALPTLEGGQANALSSCDSNGVAHCVGALLPAYFGSATAAVRWRVALDIDGALIVDPQPVVLESGLGAEAFAVNDNGAVAGKADYRARVWLNGTGQTLADYPSRKIKGVNYRAIPSNTAFGINNQGTIVGSLGVIPGTEAGLWTTSTAVPINMGQQYLPNPFSLLTSGLYEARAINNFGLIAGTGYVNPGEITNQQNASSFTFLAIPQ